MKNLIKIIESNYDHNMFLKKEEKKLVLNCILEGYLCGLKDAHYLKFNGGTVKELERKAIDYIARKIEQEIKFLSFEIINENEEDESIKDIEVTFLNRKGFKKTARIQIPLDWDSQNWQYFGDNKEGYASYDTRYKCTECGFFNRYFLEKEEKAEEMGCYNCEHKIDQSKPESAFFAQPLSMEDAEFLSSFIDEINGGKNEK